MAVVTITAAGASTWTVPKDCQAGTVITTECWGAGAGASGRVSATFGAGGGGGAYAQGTYTVTPSDVASGIAYTVGGKSSGTSGSNPSNGGTTTFGTANVNLVRNSTNYGAVAGTPGTLPTFWLNSIAGAAQTIVGSGVDGGTGFPYIDIQFNGTTSGTSTAIWFEGNQAGNGPLVVSPSTSYTGSFYIAFVAGATTNTTGVRAAWDQYNGATYVTTTSGSSSMPTGSLVRRTASATSGVSTNTADLYLQLLHSSGVAVNITLRIAGVQFEQAAAATTFVSTPVVTVAEGGQGPLATVGGLAGRTLFSTGNVETNAGGPGANFNASGSGGGGSGGLDGAGVAGNTSGHGGQGDATTGGLGGAVKASSPGNPGIANAEGGGGGGSVTAAGTGGAGGAPGGGGGAGVIATGTGGAGADGQIRITYQQWSMNPVVKQNYQMQAILTQ